MKIKQILDTTSDRRTYKILHEYGTIPYWLAYECWCCKRYYVCKKHEKCRPLKGLNRNWKEFRKTQYKT